MKLGKGSWERPHDPKVAETRLAILSNQDVVLDVLSISVRVHSVLRVAYRTDGTMWNTQPVKIREAVAHLSKLLRRSQLVISGHQSQDRWARTSIRRLALGFIWMCWVMFPPGVHGLMIQNGYSASETSMMGSTFG